MATESSTIGVATGMIGAATGTIGAVTDIHISMIAAPVLIDTTMVIGFQPRNARGGTRSITGTNII